MKIQIDTNSAYNVIRLNNGENVRELIDNLKQLLPNNLWGEFYLECDDYIEWDDLIIWRDIYVRPVESTDDPLYPHVPWLVCEPGKSYATATLNNGIYNVEI
ncbi:MAG: hypothetical protein PHS33_08415 [Candidatus Omnitrophica bacterium]|nr:hypothetical protein [Candidatus Omnitrophota bacterium]